jgi:hypothetical protein
MTTTTTTYPASAAQSSFIASLIAKRQVPADTLAAIKGTENMTSRQASAFIDLLKTMPYAPAATDAESPFAKFMAAFEGVEDSKYAVPGAYFTIILPALSHDELVFFEVKTWKGRRYLNRLHGAPGDFTRTRFSFEDGAKVLGLLARRHVEFAQAFGAHYTVCGRCAAPLTDAESRRVHLGPECRKVWGI